MVSLWYQERGNTMEKPLIVIPNGCCEYVYERNGELKPNHFKILRSLIPNEPKTNVIIQILMGSGFIYNGMIYHKTKEYAYIYLA